MLTDPGDLVLDPFAGSCVTGEVSERIERRWVCVELLEEYLEGGIGRFKRDPAANGKYDSDPDDESNYYRMARPGILWDGTHGDPLPADGGIKRPAFAQPARPARTRPGAISGSETGGKAVK